jgi:tripartite ATP-independent transporter DctP family solute receptor
MTSNAVTRRTFVTGAALGSAALLVRPWASLGRAAQRGSAEFSFTQFHNQTAESFLHQRIAEMWAAINTETEGRVEAQVFPLNNRVAGSDPAALKMLVAGDIQFFTLMGGVMSQVVPAGDVQQVPFAFRSAAHAHEAMDGALGAYIREEMAIKGIHGFPVGAFDNGMRHITAVTRPVMVPADLEGMKIRVPAGLLFNDMFRTLGAEPVTINSINIYAALNGGRADAQENPLALVDSFKLYEVVKYVSMTGHMWSGFNQMAHLPTWQRLPPDVQQVIERHVARAVRLQRQDQAAANGRLRAELTAARGLTFNDVDQAPFRAALSGFYRRWKDTLGARCWALLEEAAGQPLA